MRKVVFSMLLAAAPFFLPASASALPGALTGEAASGALSAGAVEPVAYRNKAKHKRYAKKYPRRYDWSYYPYWRPYQYRYWKFYYPYGGPLF